MPSNTFNKSGTLKGPNAPDLTNPALIGGTAYNNNSTNPGTLQFVVENSDGSKGMTPPVGGAPAAPLDLNVVDGGLGTVPDALTLDHSPTPGVPIAGVGVGLRLRAFDSTSVLAYAAGLAGLLTNATHGAVQGALVFFAGSGGGRAEVGRMQYDGGTDPALVVGEGDGGPVGGIAGGTVRAPDAAGTNQAATGLRLRSGRGTGNGAAGFVTIGVTDPEATTPTTPQTVVQVVTFGWIGGVAPTGPTSGGGGTATQLLGGLAVNRRIGGGTAVTFPAYTIGNGDYYLGVTRTTVGTCAITLPSPVTSSMAGQVFEIVDEGGNCAANNITVIATAPAKLAGVTGGTLTLAVNRTSVVLTTDGVDWFVVQAPQFAPTFSTQPSPAGLSGISTTALSAASTTMTAPVGATRYVLSVQTTALAGGTPFAVGTDLAAAGSLPFPVALPVNLTPKVRWLAMAASSASDSTATITAQWF